jgi:BMFP domain-containing protein YqiC
VPRPSIDEIARRVLDALPHAPGGANSDLRRNLRTGVSGVLARMDLVTREEFDAQLRVLQRTREKLESLEQRVNELEQRVGLETERDPKA